MTTHDQHTDAYDNQPAGEHRDHIPEDQVAPMRDDVTATQGAGPA